MEMEAGGAASRRSRRGRKFGRDRISALPDAVLGEIISLLPVREGARTQILASRWRHIWCSAPLNLDCNNLVSLDSAGMVSRILSSHQGPGRRFRVSPYWITIPNNPIDDSSDTKSAVVDAWFRSPALDNLQELDVEYPPERPINPFSASILRLSATLRVVSVQNCNFSDTAVQGLHFPKLQQLTLKLVSIPEGKLNRMIVGCPALECLMIHGCFGFRCVRINSPCLTSIGVVVEWYPPKELHFEELIIENAPCLKRLLHKDRFGRSTEDLHVSVLSAPKLETLRCVLNRNCLSTKLSFGSTTIQGLHVDSLTVVVRTVKILDVTLGHLSLDTVINLMRCFPCLEKLYMQVIRPWRTSEQNFWRRKYQNLSQSLDIRLKIIMLYSYRGSRSEVNFLTFFLLNAKALESVTLVVTSERAKNEEFIAKQRRELQLENIASVGAQFHVTDRMCASYWADI